MVITENKRRPSIGERALNRVNAVIQILNSELKFASRKMLFDFHKSKEEIIKFRVRIIASHFGNYKLNSIYCDCNIVNHRKVAKQFFSQGNFNSSTYFSTLCTYFILPLYTIIKINIAYSQNYTTNCRKSFAILKKKFSCDVLKAPLSSTYIMRSGFQTIIRMLQFNCNL